MKSLLLVSTTILLFFSESTFSQTTLTLQPGPTLGKDAEIGLLVPNNNYGSNGKCSPYAWTQNGALNVVRPLIEFDLSSIPANATITDAKLSLFHNPNYAPITEHSGSNALLIQRITSAWAENSVTWNTQPTTSLMNEVQVLASTSKTQDYLNMNVTALVQDMLNDPTNSYGFMLKLETEDPYAVVMLSSSDNVDISNHPKLVVTYHSLGLSESNKFKSIIHLYPNPTKGNITVDLGEIKSDLTATISNSLGQIISTYTYDSADVISIDIDASPGIYFMKLETALGEREMVRILKE